MICIRPYPKKQIKGMHTPLSQDWTSSLDSSEGPVRASSPFTSKFCASVDPNNFELQPLSTWHKLSPKCKVAIVLNEPASP